MKKLYCMIFILMISFCAFAKEKPLQVTETEWGFQVSNINSKGKIICKGYLDCKLPEDVFVILRTKDSIFNIEVFAEEIVNNKHNSNVFILNEKGFSELERNKKTESGADTGLVLLDIAIAISEATEKEGFYLGDSCESLLVLTQKGKISQVEAYQNGRNLQLIISDLQKANPTQLEVLVTEKKAEKEKLSSNKASINDKSEILTADEKEHLKELWEKAGKEGYDHMPWGTSISEFKILYPKANHKKQGCLNVYTREGSSKNVEMSYGFYNNALVAGSTTYKEVEETKGMEEDINIRMSELYGNPTDEENESAHHVQKISDEEKQLANEMLRMFNMPYRISANHIDYTEKHHTKTWNKSKTFMIILQSQQLIGDSDVDNTLIEFFINKSLHTITISYQDQSMTSQINESNLQLEKKQQEEKKAAEEAEKRKRLDNLDL